MLRSAKVNGACLGLGFTVQGLRFKGLGIRLGIGGLWTEACSGP